MRRFGIRIRTKLLLATLVLALIPFVGYGYVRELESFLRSGQEQAVIGTARAAATALHDRPKLLELRSSATSVPIPPELTNPDLPLPLPEDGPLNRGINETALNDRIRITRPTPEQANEEIDLIIRGMGRGNARIWVVDQQRRQLAVTGSLQRDQRRDPLIPAASEGIWGQIEERFLRPLYTWLLAPPNEDFEDALPETVLSGGRDLDRALSGIAASRWRHTTDFRATVISAAHPIWSGDEVVGAIVIEETANAVLMLRNRAFEHLLTMTLAVFLFGAGALALFATRISSRLARLRDEADSAIDLRGRVKHLVQGSDAGDEIGDLSRSFSTMLARLAQYNTYLERMADRLSHELRTPAAVVSSSLDNLRSKNLPGDAEVYIRRAEEGVKRLNDVLTRMREATQLENMLREVERERFDLARVVAGCVEGYRGVFTTHRFLPVLPPTPAWLLGSPDLVAQLLDKIVENAADFSPPGEMIEVTVAFREAFAVLTVSNIGPLLPDAMQGEIFESMISVRDKAEGGKSTPHLGLGLFMVRLIAEFHNAKAAADNRTDGRGVAIEIAFPLAI